MSKTVLITGATKGIGLATSHRLNKEGWLVIGIARHEDSHFPGKLYLCDLSNAQQTAQLLSAIANEHDVDAVVNNVGIAMPQPLEKIDLSTLQNVYDLNVRVAVQTVQTFVEKMKEQRWGRVVNIASRAIFGAKDRTSYAAAKCALVGCTRTWALELASFNITVNAVAPGPVETELFRKARPVGSEAEKTVLAEIPLSRLGQPDEIAASIAFLLSDDAGFITGQTLRVDGGGSI